MRFLNHGLLSLNQSMATSLDVSKIVKDINDRVELQVQINQKMTKEQRKQFCQEVMHILKRHHEPDSVLKKAVHCSTMKEKLG